MNKKFEKRVSEESIEEREMSSGLQEKGVETKCDEQEERLPDTYNMEWEVVRNLNSLYGPTESGVFLTLYSFLILINITLFRIWKRMTWTLENSQTV